MFESRKDIKDLQFELNFMYQRLGQFDEADYAERLKRAVSLVLDELVERELKGLALSVLSSIEKDIPVTALVANGYQSIYDISHLSKIELQKIKGVGPVYAGEIVSGISKIKASKRKDARLKIDPEHVTEASIILLQILHDRLVKRDEHLALRKEVHAFAQKWKATIYQAKEKRGFVGRLFQGKADKANIDEAFALLNGDDFLHTYKGFVRQFESREEVDQDRLINHFIQHNIDYYSEIERVLGVDLSQLTDELPHELIDEINAFPLNKDGLELTFRSYQAFGSKYALHFKRTLLGDEMGLGKTIQGLGMINHLYQEGKRHSIVVCPLSLLSNWKREIERFSKLPVYIFHGRQRESELAKWEEDAGGVLLTTYEHTVHLDLSIDHLAALIVDEAHYVKNPGARRSKNVYRIAELAEYALFMSGTPLENNVDEMKQLVKVLQPEVGKQLSQNLYLLEPSRFKATIQEVYLRRNRSDVLAELPELEMKEEWTEFGKEEAKIYRDAVDGGGLMLMRRAAWLGGSPSRSPKLERLLEICDRAKENGHKVIVFSFFKDVLNVVHDHLEGRTYDVISGDVPNSRRQEIIDDFSNGEDGAVLISQITAGGVGLNIQAANIVILCEPQWKPSIENQAISRAYRMGQARKVLVYRLLTESSIDESMLDILDYKSHLFDLYARESEITDVQASEADEPDDKNAKAKVLEREKERMKERVG